MAYWLHKKNTGGLSNQAQFFMDSDDDVTSLPTITSNGVDQHDGISHYKVGKGSLALSLDSSKFYVLKSDGTWKQV